MLTDQLQQLQTAKAHVAELKQKIATERKQALATLPAQYGFADMVSFIRALRETQGKRRARITDATGISRATIQNVKAQLGLGRSVR